MADNINPDNVPSAEATGTESKAPEVHLEAIPPPEVESAVETEPAQPHHSTAPSNEPATNIAKEVKDEGEQKVSQKLETKKEPKKGRRVSMFAEDGDRQKVSPPVDTDDLVGTLQSFFTQVETNEDKVLKPLRRPKLLYENTYRLESKKPFSSDKVTIVIKKTLEEMLEKVKYKSATASDLSLVVAEKIRSRVMTFRFDRYRIVVYVTLGPLNRQGQIVAFRALWDGARDNYAYHTFKNAYIYCSAVVYGLYYE